jgi:hypothetical protein
MATRSAHLYTKSYNAMMQPENRERCHLNSKIEQWLDCVKPESLRSERVLVDSSTRHNSECSTTAYLQSSRRGQLTGPSQVAQVCGSDGSTRLNSHLGPIYQKTRKKAVMKNALSTLIFFAVCIWAMHAENF